MFSWEFVLCKIFQQLCLHEEMLGFSTWEQLALPTAESDIWGAFVLEEMVPDMWPPQPAEYTPWSAPCVPSTDKSYARFQRAQLHFYSTCNKLEIWTYKIINWQVDKGEMHIFFFLLQLESWGTCLNVHSKEGPPRLGLRYSHIKPSVWLCYHMVMQQKQSFKKFNLRPRGFFFSL